jgi:tRNA threonylcarbamoyladenosine biosynthesis protein TsaB
VAQDDTNPLRLLALDTGTQTQYVGVSVAQPDAAEPRVWQRCGEGGAQASQALIPAVLGLLDEAGVSLRDLDAVVFGRGPGTFTGLRTACAVVQGLAYGTRTPAHPQGLPVLGVDSLWAVAEDARLQWLNNGCCDGLGEGNTDCHRDPSQGALPMREGPLTVTAVLDARMDEVYAATYLFEAVVPGKQTVLSPPARCVGGPWLRKPEQLAAVLPSCAWQGLLAGDALDTYGQRLPTGMPRLRAAPTALALLRLAPALLAQGLAGTPATAQPLYVRDRVAQTTAEREAAQQTVREPVPGPVATTATPLNTAA